MIRKANIPPDTVRIVNDGSPKDTNSGDPKTAINQQAKRNTNNEANETNKTNTKSFIYKTPILKF